MKLFYPTLLRWVAPVVIDIKALQALPLIANLVRWVAPIAIHIKAFQASRLPISFMVESIDIDISYDGYTHPYSY